MEIKPGRSIARRWFWILSICWTLVVGLSMALNYRQERRQAEETAKIEVRAYFKKDNIYREWNALAGGLYAPVSAMIRPNPFLDFLPDRDITLPSGKELTLVNPAYMSRQISELMKEEYGIRGHLTSLKPLRPENRPDRWEAEALRSFEEGGVAEVSGISEINGEPYMRLMQPLYVKESCLKCHERQGYRLGDIRGGMSASVPMAPHLAMARTRILTLTAGHLSFWVLGLLGLVYGTRKLGRLLDGRIRHEEELSLKAQLLDRANDSIYVHDMKGRLVYVNEAACRTWGYDRTALLTMNISELAVARSAGLVRASTAELRGAGECSFESTHLHRDGTRREMEVSSRLIESGGERLVMNVARDISERKAVEEELRKLSQTVEQSPSVVMITDTSGVIEYVNPRFCELTGYSSDEAVGCTPSILSSGEHGAAFYDELWRTIKSGRTWRGEFHNRKKDGSLYWERAAIAPIVDERGEITHFVAVKEEISDKKRVEEEKQTLQAQLLQAQKMEAVGRLAGGIAHDFNNVLTAIMGYAELVLDGVSDGQMRKDIGEIISSTNRAAALTRQLLAFSRRQILAKRLLDLNELVRGMGKLLHRLIGEDIELVMETEADLRSVHADPGQLEQVLMNLAVNARDAMPEGGRLTVRTANASFDEEAATLFHNGRRGNFVLLSVEDTGEGIDRAAMEHIFDPFFTTKEADKGTGLGLSVVYGIIKQHNGWIDCRSERHKGTVFDIYLPAYDVKPEGVSPPSEREAGELCGSGEPILVVEDEANLREFMTRLLREKGFRVLPAGSAAEAGKIVKAESEPIRIVISDVILPDQTGVNLADSLTREHPWLNILLMSGYSERRIDWDELRRKGYRFLQKPFSPSQLLAAVVEMTKR
ncbi:MAG TPA: PAS domain S-box protein [Deltaproteobacteria bacterium]|nr:PAS domain S-box protein [Deltaproteobacteria bacterium]